MSQIAINTSQNVNINFNVSNVGERFVAFFIDFLIKYSFAGLCLYLFYGFFKLGYILQGMDNWSQGAVYLIILLPSQLYFLVLETLMDGQTPGKKIMKLRVVKIDGYQAGFGDYLIRWIFRIIDVSILLIGLIAIIVSKNNQRLGDMAAGTAVISLRNDINISHTILENIQADYVPQFPQVVALNDNDMRIIKENYVSALNLDDRKVISRLSTKIKELLKIEIDPTKMTERQFVGTVIKDYNYYTGRDL
ncbi:transporter [Chryseobacterium sp. Leaf180]|uniref:RDD family protein n=1 Tax=Chryseobacterium sp. Leaf180 TaxID=1736289 RepID=UPI0006FCD898|nr:RDD family protein [Chryseobacterium sp. Leaf180]KQR95585.1 transporter [Chryseobacterium sp. Leaf180]